MMGLGEPGTAMKLTPLPCDQAVPFEEKSGTDDGCAVKPVLIMAAARAAPLASRTLLEPNLDIMRLPCCYALKNLAYPYVAADVAYRIRGCFQHRCVLSTRRRSANKC